MSEFVVSNVASLSGHSSRVWSCAWSPGGTALATCSSDRTVRIWKRQTNVGAVDPSAMQGVGVGYVFAQHRAGGSDCLVEVSPDKCREGLKLHEQPVSLNDWYCWQTIETEHSKSLRHVSWSPSGRHLAVASFDHTVSIWELVNGQFECTATLEGQEHEIKAVSWSCNGDLLCTCSRDKSIWVWSHDDTDENSCECFAVLTGHTQDIKFARFHPNNDDIISASYDNSVKVWEAQDDDWYCAQTLQDHSNTVWQVAFSSDAQYLASVSDDRQLIVYQQENGKSYRKCASIPNLHDRSIFSVSWSKPMMPAATEQVPIGYQGFIATAGADDKVQILHAQHDEAGNLALSPATNVVAHTQDANCVAWNPKIANVFATVGDDQLVKIWRLEL